MSPLSTDPCLGQSEHMQAWPRERPLGLKLGADTHFNERIRTHLERKQTVACVLNGGFICAGMADGPLADLVGCRSRVHSNLNTPHT